MFRFAPAKEKRRLAAVLNATGPRPSPTEKCLYRFVPAKGKRRLAACKRSARFVYLHCQPLLPYGPSAKRRDAASPFGGSGSSAKRRDAASPFGGSGPSAKRRDAASPFLVAPAKGKRRLAACKRSARSVPVTVSRCHDKEQLRPSPYNERARAFARALRCRVKCTIHALARTFASAKTSSLGIGVT